MIKVKKSLALLIILFLILSNFAFAQPDTHYYAGKPVEPSKEGNVIVYPAGRINSEEQRMVERFSKGDISEEEMHTMAKAKSGKNFDEMEFQKEMMEFKERMERKDAFSYEHEGYEQKYYTSPSYEGYSKEHMIFGMIFEYIGDDIDPREIKQYCNEQEKIADIAIEKLRNKVGDFQKVCNRIDEREAKCEEYAKKGCSQIGIALVREDATEMEKLQAVAYACPANKDAIVESCKKRSKLHMEQRLQNINEMCEKRFGFEGERLLKECERFRQNTICDKEKFIERCLGGIKREDYDENKSGPSGNFQYVQWQCYGGSTESHSDASCKSSQAWQELARKSCESKCSEEGKCGVNRFSVSGECKTTRTCQAYPAPSCGEGTKLQTKTDANGCTYYYCESMQIACTADVRQCPDGSYVARDPAKNCEFKQCPSIACAKPTCEGAEDTGKRDANGCIVYACPTNKCPEVSRPTCAEGQSMTTKYDDKGCITGYGCVIVSSTSITGSAVGVSNYNDLLRQCENSWQGQQRICLNIPDVCDRSAFIEKCKLQERKNYDDVVQKIEQHCQSETIAEIKHAEERCSRIDEERQRCFDENTKRCSQMKGLAQQCRDSLNEEKLRDFIIEEVKKRCKFTDIIEDEEDVRKAEKVEIVLAVLNTVTEDDINKLELFVDDLEEELKLQDTTVYKGTIEPNGFRDVKLLSFVVNAKLSTIASSEKAKEVKGKIVAGQKTEEIAGKLASLRDSDVPSEYLYIIEDKASDVLNVSGSLEEIGKKEEQKGRGYKIRLFLGLAKAAEQQEVKQLSESKDKLQNSIETLTKLIDEVPSDVAKAVLKEQVENLKKQQAEIEVLIETKEKKAKGLFGLFG